MNLNNNNDNNNKNNDDANDEDNAFYLDFQMNNEKACCGLTC